MKLEMLKSKLHQACITHADVDYEGSFGIDVELMEAVGLCPHEKVLVANINNGNRLETYVIPERFGSRRMVLNGAAARLGSVGDRVIVMAFAWVAEEDVRSGRHRPRIVRLDRRNEPVHPIARTFGVDAITSMLGG
ncbi:MAG: aspartate 1-decarboxylase [Phycisphaerae bacterium]